MARTNQNCNKCMAGQIRKIVPDTDKFLTADELYEKLKGMHFEQACSTSDHHRTLTMKDGSQLKLVDLEVSFEKGSHTTPVDLTVWDGTLN